MMDRIGNLMLFMIKIKYKTIQILRFHKSLLVELLKYCVKILLKVIVYHNYLPHP